jgi:hypothetical protein
MKFKSPLAVVIRVPNLCSLKWVGHQIAGGFNNEVQRQLR